MAISNTLSIASIIIDALAIIIAVVAICVAVHGNRQSQKQFQDSMVKQEQALNAQLLDKRIQVLNYFRKEGHDHSSHFLERYLYGTNVDIELFRALFSRALVQEYEELCRIDQECSRLKSSASAILHEFKRLNCSLQTENEDISSYLNGLKRAEDEALSVGATDKEKEQFKAISGRLTAINQDGNYSEMVLRWNELARDLEKRKKAFLEALMEEIKHSVDYTEIMTDSLRQGNTHG